MLNFSSLNVFLSSILKKYTLEKHFKERNQFLYLTAVNLYLNKQFNESLKILKSIEESIEEQLIPDLLILQALIYIVSNNFNLALEKINSAIVFIESDNKDLLNSLETNSFSELFENSKLPKLKSSKSLHLLLLIIDIWATKNNLDIASNMLKMVFKYENELKNSQIKPYAFYLHLLILKSKNPDQKYFVNLNTIMEEILLSHKMEYGFFKMEYLILLFNMKKHVELSFYEMNSDSRKSSHVQGSTSEGYLLDHLDWDPTYRFNPLINFSVNPLEKKYMSSLLRIKLSPQLII